MTKFILVIILLLLAIGGIVVRKTYYSLPLRELKRRAERHDRQAAELYRAVAYGSSLRSLLWLYIGLTSAGALLMLARWLPVWLSLLIVGPLLWAAFSWLPASRVTKLGTRLTLLVTPIIAWLLNYLHPPLSHGADVATRRTTTTHTGLFERDDLLALIEQQRVQTDNRLSDEELEIAKRALSFSDHQVSNVLIPRKAIKTVLADDTIGPVLINELHKSGQDYALVRATTKGDIVGTLRFSQLNLHSTGHVRDIMDSAVYYLHESDSLSEALHAFFVTNQAVFIVVNNAEEYLGLISIENILQQLLGHIPGEDFNQYADISAVATRHDQAKKPDKPATEKTEESEEPGDTPVKTDDEVVE